MDLSYPKNVEIPMPWGKISGKWCGPESDEPIVFIHGWQDNLGTFDGLIPLLPPGLPYFTFDLPGHGMSDLYPKGQFYYIFWDGLILIRRLVQYFKWKKITLIGHSLGGGIGFLYAASFPNETAGLVSIDIACPRVPKPSTLVDQMPHLIDKYLNYESMDEESMQPRYNLEEMTDIAVDGYRGSVSRYGVGVLLKRGTKRSKVEPSKFVFSRDVRLKVGGVGLPSRDLMLEMASRIKCRYLNIKADNSITVEQPEIYNEILDAIKKSASSFAFHEVKGTHHVHLNNPEIVAPLITKFLENK